MSGIESYVVFFPRFTTLAAGVGAVSFTSIPLDVSQFGGVQMEAWMGEVLPYGGTSHFKIYLEESLDGTTWEDEMSTVYEFDQAHTYAGKFFSFGFRLRWFRVRLELTNINLVTTYVEGIMRAGGGGAREWTLSPSEQSSSSAPGPKGSPDVSGPAIPGRAAGSTP